MKSIVLSCWLVCLGLCTLSAGDAAPATNPRLCVMTFNLRYASDRPPNAWPERRPVMAETIRKLAPDLIGTQEGLYAQLKDLAADLPEFEWIGLGREGGSHGEFMAVFYRRARLEPLEYDHFWLSDTPEVIGSSTWGNKNRRMLTWVRFRDRESGREFYYANTHLDHEIQLAREKAAELIRQRLDPLAKKLPLVLGGDFNAAAGANKAYDILVQDGGFTDLWLAAAQRRGEGYKTFHNFRGPQPGDERIDWLLCRGGFKAEEAETVLFARDGIYPSDHFPVVAWLRAE